MNFSCWQVLGGTSSPCGKWTPHHKESPATIKGQESGKSLDCPTLLNRFHTPRWSRNVHKLTWRSLHPCLPRGAWEHVIKPTPPANHLVFDLGQDLFNILPARGFAILHPNAFPAGHEFDTYAFGAMTCVHNPVLGPSGLFQLMDLPIQN